MDKREYMRTHLVEMVKLFWGDDAAHEFAPLEVLARTNAHCGDVVLTSQCHKLLLVT